MMSSDDEVVNILSLDGGGVRALSGIMMLDRIMKRIQEKQGLSEIPKPCDYFHLIGGIGTGGIAAILFGRLRMTTTEALTGYENIASEIFSTYKRRLEFSIDFREEKVERGMKNIMKDRRKDGEQMRDEKGGWSTGKAFVVGRRPDGSLHRIRAYRHKETQMDFTIYEAARATAACIEGPSEQYFSNNTKDYKNPTQEVLDEATQALDSTAKVGLVLSLGTGTREIHNRVQLTKDGKIRDAEITDFCMKRRFSNVPDTYFRLNVNKMADKVKANKAHEIPVVKRATEDWLGSSGMREVIDTIVDILINNKTSGVTVAKLALDEINPTLKQEDIPNRPSTTHPDPVSRADTSFSYEEPTYNPNDRDPNFPIYRSEQASLWAQYTSTESSSTLGPIAPESLDLLHRIFDHMLLRHHFSCALHVAEEGYKRALTFARNNGGGLGIGPALATCAWFSNLVKAQMLLGEVFIAHDLAEELVGRFTRILGAEHKITRQAADTLAELRENKRKREWGLREAEKIMTEHEKWTRGGKEEKVLRKEVGDQEYEERDRQYRNAVMLCAGIPTEDVCRALGCCKEKGFREVKGRLGICDDVEVERGLVEDFS